MSRLKGGIGGGWRWIRRDGAEFIRDGGDGLIGFVG